jgi:hypothetical protein
MMMIFPFDSASLLEIPKPVQTILGMLALILVIRLLNDFFSSDGED